MSRYSGVIANNANKGTVIMRMGTMRQKDVPGPTCTGPGDDTSAGLATCNPPLQRAHARLQFDVMLGVPIPPTIQPSPDDNAGGDR